MSRGMIELIEVTKKFGEKTAVDRLTLRVAAGELFAFLGPNGAGKTTTIKLLCGLLRANSGTIRVGPFDLQTNGREARRLLSYVPDQPYLYEKLTGREFLEFVVSMYGIEPDRAARNIRESIDLFEMGDYIDQLTENYSHGMKQRVVFAAALVHDPQVLVVDEPMVGLDPRSARLIKDLFRRKVSEGMAVFMSTHTLNIAEQVADTIGIVQDGRLLCCDSLVHLRRRFETDRSLEDLYFLITEGAGGGAEARPPERPAGPHFAPSRPVP
jgi:ABC-2 type transport system ATP-binding protein